MITVYSTIILKPEQHTVTTCNNGSVNIPFTYCGYEQRIDSNCIILEWYTQCNMSMKYNWVWMAQSICDSLGECEYVTPGMTYENFDIISIRNSTLEYDIVHILEASNKSSLFPDIPMDSVYTFIISLAALLAFFCCIGVRMFFMQEERRLVA